VGKLLSAITCESDQEVDRLFVIQDIGVTTKYWRSSHSLVMISIFYLPLKNDRCQIILLLRALAEVHEG
jgi:hypothetical protein